MENRERWRFCGNLVDLSYCPKDIIQMVLRTIVVIHNEQKKLFEKPVDICFFCEKDVCVNWKRGKSLDIGDYITIDVKKVGDDFFLKIWRIEEPQPPQNVDDFLKNVP